MDARFRPHNTHLLDPQHFAQRDPQLSELAQQIYVHKPAMLGQLPWDTPGIYTLGGGRQVGKTTLLKQWMAELLAKGVAPSAIAFLTGELIDDHHTLVRLVEGQLQTMPDSGLRYLLLDEVTYIRDWDKAIKYAADAGILEGTILLLTGSDLAVIREARMRFPGRRGKAATVDFHLYPLSFRETVALKDATGELCALADAEPTPDHVIDALFEHFDAYLIHGGYLTAINDLAVDGTISPATLNTYSDWIRGDVLKRGKSEHYLREILSAITKRYNSQVTWNALARDLSIDHPKTVADYAELLASMDALFIQQALLEHRLTGAPKKARKLMFTDPFIFHAARSWLAPEEDPYQAQILPATRDPALISRLVEACVTTHLRRYYPTYYIKAEGEVDIAFVRGKRFWPIEIKWTTQLRPKDLKQVAKYPHARILAKTRRRGEIERVPIEPLPLALLRLPQTWPTNTDNASFATPDAANIA